jgi:cell division protein FtsQ
MGGATHQNTPVMKGLARKIAPLFGALVLLVLLGFVTRHQNHMKCKGVDIVVHSEAEMYFIDRDDVYHQVINAADSVEGRRMITLDTRHIENAIGQLPEVKKVDVFKTIHGKLQVNVDLRVPVARVFNPNGTSFYIDEAGEMMPLSTKYIARVLTVNGHIKQAALPTGKELQKVSVWGDQQRDIHRLASFIQRDPFWNAQIQQLYVNENLDYVLIPRVGNYEIHIGKMTDIETKFNHLNAFYEQSLSQGDWNQYRIINLKYKDQIVCNKK